MGIKKHTVVVACDNYKCKNTLVIGLSGAEYDELKESVEKYIEQNTDWKIHYPRNEETEYYCTECECPAVYYDRGYW